MQTPRERTIDRLERGLRDMRFSRDKLMRDKAHDENTALSYGHMIDDIKEDIIMQEQLIKGLR